MNIFISWSGERSHQVALLFKDWIKGVIQASKPWVSSEDIESGSRWFAQISEQLDATSQGIICITQENKEKPWILYEAGALSKGQSNPTHVTPLLIDLQTQDITGPLAQFNAVSASKEENMRKLILDLNKRLPTDTAVDELVLKRVFSAFWPDFSAGLEKIIADTQATAPPEKKREEDSMIVEMLQIVRSLDKRVKSIEEVSNKSVPALAPPRLFTREEYEVRMAERRQEEEVGRIRQERLKRNAQMIVAVDKALSKGMTSAEIIALAAEKFPEYSEKEVLLRIQRWQERNSTGEV